MVAAKKPLPVSWYGWTSTRYASSPYSGAASTISQPGAVVPGRSSLVTIGSTRKSSPAAQKITAVKAHRVGAPARGTATSSGRLGAASIIGRAILLVRLSNRPVLR